ncbi:MAG: glycine cleavage system protein H [Candidatus Deferrimicrobiaceae bacterium]
MVLALILTTIAAFLLIEFAFRMWSRRAKERAGTIAPALRTALVPAALPEFRLPGGLFYHSGHTWAHLTPSGEAEIGIDDFAQGIIGRIDRIELPRPGERLRQGEKAFTVVQGNKKIDFVSPLDGIVSAANDDMNADTGKLKKDPYRSSWLLSAMPTNVAQNIRKLRIAGDASAWLERELMVFLEFITLHRATPQEVGVTMQDGGHCIEGVTESIDGELLQLLVKKFFR